MPMDARKSAPSTRATDPALSGSLFEKGLENLCGARVADRFEGVAGVLAGEGASPPVE